MVWNRDIVSEYFTTVRVLRLGAHQTIVSKAIFGPTVVML